MDDVSNDVSERVEARENAWRRVTLSNGVWARDQRNRAFEQCVGACAVSDGVETFTSL